MKFGVQISIAGGFSKVVNRAKINPFPNPYQIAPVLLFFSKVPSRNESEIASSRSSPPINRGLLAMTGGMDLAMTGGMDLAKTGWMRLLRRFAPRNDRMKRIYKKELIDKIKIMV